MLIAKSSNMSSGFITESEIAEAKRVRQEEWEKVRNKEDPEEVIIFKFRKFLILILFNFIGS